jgi:hypothetical protein
MLVLNLDRLAPYQGTARDKQPYGGSSWRTAARGPTHEEGRLNAVETGRISVDPEGNHRRHKHVLSEKKKWQ